ncbi:MAG: M20 family metallopeptidase [Caldilineaceae bacterium]
MPATLTTPAQLLAWFDEHADEMLKAVRAVVEEETPSNDPVRLNAFARRLAARFRAAGAHTELVPNIDGGEHVRARFLPRGTPTEPPALLLCHYDTVWPVGSLETHPFRVEGGKAYGPGIFDMQSSLILAEFALRAIATLQLTLPRPVTVLVTSDEEIGSPSSRDLIEEEALKSAYVLVLESPLPGGVLKTARKGVGDFLVEITGRAAHAGVEPEKGVSAIHEAAHQVLALQALGNPAEGTTVSVGMIQGGSASNVIPARCLLEVDTRAWKQAEADRIEAAIRSLVPVLPDATITVTGGWNRPPLERKATAALYERAYRIGATLGLTLGEGSTGGGSDGNFTAALGIPTLDGLGVPGAGAHADHEHIEVEHLPGRGALLAAMLAQL